jgi:digeranylgeranylglycerophospholipid reductase
MNADGVHGAVPLAPLKWHNSLLQEYSSNIIPFKDWWIDMEGLTYDAVIVGAGPAGSMTAKVAAEEGAKVLIIEKRQEIGTPVRCGEGIARVWLNEVGIEPDPKWIAHQVDGARIISPSGHVLLMDESIAGNECGYVVNRDAFDKELARQAVSAGADLMVKTSATAILREGDYITGVKAKYMKDSFNIQAPITVAADGFESKIGRWAGIDTNLKPKDLNVCFQYFMVDVDIDSRYNDFYVGSIAPGGYIWIFAKGKDCANVGIGVNLAKIGKDDRGAAKRYLDEFIDSHPNLKKGKKFEQIAGAISCCMPLDKTVANGLMLVGDAARQIDPITGGGVANACKAGKVAGKVIAKAVSSGDFSEKFLMEYDKGWRDEFENQMIRNFIAKEKLVTLSDETFDKIVYALEDVELTRVTTLDILKAVQSKAPELVKEFEDLL